MIFSGSAVWGRGLGEKLEAQEGDHKGGEYGQKSAKSMKLAEVISSRAEAELSAEISGSHEKNKSNRSEIAVSGPENRFSQ